MKKAIIIFAIVSLIFVGYFVLNNNYQIKITFETENLDTEYIDINLAQEIKKKLFKSSEVQEIVSFSNEFGFNLYCKINLLKLNKKEEINNIQNITLNFYNKNKKEIKNIAFDNKYNLDYSDIIILKDKNPLILNKEANELYKKLLEKKLFKKIGIYGKQKIANSIYFQNKDLLNYNLNLKDLKTIITKNNQNRTTIIENDNYFQNPKYDTKIKTIADLKEIQINYPKEKLTNSFSNIFEIKEEIKTPSKGYIFKNKDYAIAIGIKKNRFFPNILLKPILKKHNAQLIKLSKYKKVEICLNENKSIEETINFYKKIVNNLNVDAIYFIGLNPFFYKFKEKYNFRIIILVNKKNIKKLTNFLSKENVSFSTKNKSIVKLNSIYATQIDYTFKDNELEKFDIDKEEFFNAILTQNEGLKIGSYKNKEEEIEIILKNKDKNGFIYSKAYNALINKDVFLIKNLKEKPNIIIRKNFTQL